MYKVGHRGASGHEPENTLLSFQRAIDFGVDMFELDVRLCATGEVVVMHDPTVDRTTDGEGYVSDLPLSYIKKLDAGKGEKVPMLDEVIKNFVGKARINIELKEARVAAPVAAILHKYVNKLDVSKDNFLLASFKTSALAAFKLEDRADIDIAPICSYFPLRSQHFLRVAKKLGASAVYVPNHFLKTKFVDEAHRQMLKVYVGVLNKKKDIEKRKEMDVDGIFSDYPDLI